MQQSRRQFLKGAVAVSAVSRGNISGANERVRLAAVGCGGRTSRLSSLLSELGGCEIAAVCDVYEPRRRGLKQRSAPGASEYGDYRRVLERQDIDAVVIGSPDHWHVPMTIDAIQAGKDVYVEKPVSHSVAGSERLKRAAAESRQVIQVGYQQRSWEHFRIARDVVAEGKLGTVHMVLTSWYQTWMKLAADRSPVNLPELDWKRWQGPAPQTEFSAERFYNWRWFWDYGGGHLTDLFSHWCDSACVILGLGEPVAVRALGSNFAFGVLECPDTVNAAWQFPDLLLTYNGMQNCHMLGGSAVFRGDQAMMKITRDGLNVYPEAAVKREITHLPDPSLSVPSKQDGTIAHLRNFLDCVRSRATPNAPLASSVAVANIAHLGNSVLRQAGGKTA